jgi:hypothetical protein
MSYTDNKGRGLIANPNVIYKHDLSTNFDPLNDTTLPSWVRSQFGNGFLIRAVTDGSSIGFMPFGNMFDDPDYVSAPVKSTVLPTDASKIITFTDMSNIRWEEGRVIAVYATGTNGTTDSYVWVGAE